MATFDNPHGSWLVWNYLLTLQDNIGDCHRTQIGNPVEIPRGVVHGMAEGEKHYSAGNI